MSVLGADQVGAFLAEHPEWSGDTSALRTTVQAASFLEAIAWVNACALAAEDMNHHPDIDIRWRTLHLALSTHSEGGVTALDLDLARRIDAIVGRS